MRLAHFSDLHLLSLDGAGARLFLSKRLLGGANLLLNRAHRYRAEIAAALIDDMNAQRVDHAVFSGDLVNLALPAEVRLGRALLDRLDLGAEGLTCVPGNHDVYVADAVAAYAAAVAPFTASDPGWLWADAAYPVVRVRGGAAIVGLSSAQPRGPLSSHGELGATQLDRLEAVLGDRRLAGLARVVVLHHPPAGLAAKSPLRGLRDRRAFAAVIARAGAELVLHGHEHVDLAAVLPGPGGAVPVRGIPSGSRGAGAHVARYRVYELDGGRVVGEAARTYSPASGRFA